MYGLTPENRAADFEMSINLPAPRGTGARGDYTDRIESTQPRALTRRVATINHAAGLVITLAGWMAGAPLPAPQVAPQSPIELLAALREIGAEIAAID